MKNFENSKGFKKTLKRLKKVNREINEKHNEMIEISTSLCYVFISNEKHREIDLKEVKSEIKSLLSLKNSILDSLGTETNLMKANISNLERELTLTINK